MSERDLVFRQVVGEVVVGSTATFVGSAPAVGTFELTQIDWFYSASGLHCPLFVSIGQNGPAWLNGLGVYDDVLLVGGGSWSGSQVIPQNAQIYAHNGNPASANTITVRMTGILHITLAGQ